MRRRSGLGALLALAAASLLVAGCDTSSVDGSPTATATTALNAGLFEPCDIPPAAIQAAGLDPASKNPDFFGVERTGWEACMWDSRSWYFLTVLSTTHSFDEVKANPNNVEFRAASVPGREAVTYLDVSDKNRETCDVAFPAGQGAVVVRADKSGSKIAQEDPCVVAIRAATSLNDLLPR